MLRMSIKWSQVNSPISKKKAMKVSSSLLQLKKLQKSESSLTRNQLSVRGISSDPNKQIVKRYRGILNLKISIPVATDVISRGIDIGINSTSITTFLRLPKIMCTESEEQLERIQQG